jgi:GPH family glycoside/pentoside/hexuronide:cation symporter
MNTENKMRPFGLRDKIGYLFGDLGNDFTFIFSSSFLLKFYTDVMGVSAAAVGVIMMIARFVDAFTDVTMGRICDRSPTLRAGKFKPWIRRMCAPVAFSSFLIYQSALSDMSTPFKIGYLFVTYLLWGSVFYTSINIPYGSMASTVSRNADDRQSLSTFRSIGATLAGLVIGVGVPIIAYERGEGGQTLLNGTRFTAVAGVLSVLAVVCYLLCYHLTTERVRADSTVSAREKISVAKMLTGAVKNRALTSIIAASVTMLLAQLTLQSMANYIFPNYYGNTDAQAVSTVLMTASVLVAAAFAKPISRRFGKAEMSAVSAFIAAAVSLLLFFYRPQSVWVYVGLTTVSWLGLGFFTIVSWALITDVIDYSELKNGVREDGTIYALYSFARKMGQAAAAGLSGFLLTLVGYSEATAFDRSVLNGVYTISTLLPAVGFGFLAVILKFWYPLSKKTLENMGRENEERRGERGRRGNGSLF